MDVVIFDLDGCLSDDRWRHDYLPPQPWSMKDQSAFDQYNVKCAMDEPITHVLSELDKYATNNACEVWFITGRPNAEREKTLAWIYELVTFAQEPRLFMRAPGDRRSSPEFKLSVLEHQLQNRDVTVLALYDDREDVLAAYWGSGYATPDWKLYRANIDGIYDIIEKQYDVVASVDVLNDRPPGLESVSGIEDPGDILAEMAATFKERNEKYKDNYKVVGRVLNALFPEGVTLNSEFAFTKWHLFELMIVKLTRFTNSELTHKDSIHDLAIYAAMVEFLTQEENDDE